MVDADTAAESNISTAELSAEIVSAYVSHNTIGAAEVPKLIADVYGTLASLQSNSAAPPPEELHPAVPVRKSVTADYIICLEDGRKFKSLKRHLRTQYNLTPEQYREKWGLPASYPMVAPTYSQARSSLARASGLGRKPAAKRRR